MNTLIVTGGSIDYKFACEYLKKYTWDYVVCADAGMKFCHTAGIQPDLILGDFDSVDDASYTYFKKTCPERMEQFPTHKDETDTGAGVASVQLRLERCSYNDRSYRNPYRSSAGEYPDAEAGTGQRCFLPDRRCPQPDSDGGWADNVAKI